MKYTYFLILAASVIIPFIMSFEKKIKFISKAKATLPAVSIVAIVFIIWDVLFTASGVWSFNDEYILGIKALGLPIEEIAFFFVIPYIGIFIYEIVRYYFKPEITAGLRIFMFVLAIVLVMSCFMKTNADYTFYTFLATGILVFALYKSKYQNSAYYFVSYAIILIPFLIVNGILTSLPVVIYNDTENLALRIWTIPIEDFVYLMLLLFTNYFLYDTFKKRFGIL